VSKYGAQWVQKREVHSARFFDEGFSTTYGTPRWIAANVLTFPGPAFTRATDEIAIRKRSSQPLKLLAIRTLDLSIILDLPPRGALVLPVTSQRENSDTAIEVEAVRQDGQVYKRQSGDFDRPLNLDRVRVGVDVTQGTILVFPAVPLHGR
jgi:hypothetical protein